MIAMLKKENIYHKCTTAGFSLIEVLVSLALFSIVITMSVGTLVVLMDGNAKAQENRELVNQVSLVLDGMSREIRTGYDYRCGDASQLDLGDNNNNPRDCTSGGSAFGFTESGTGLTDGMSSNRIGYRLRNGIIQRNLAGSGWVDMTPDTNMTINDLRFTLSNSAQLSTGNTRTPVVSIVIEGEVQNSMFSSTAFTLQTSVTQQSLDI